MKPLHLILLLFCFCSCHHSQYAKETMEITQYLQNFIPSQPLSNGTVILINSKGCPVCIARGYKSIKESKQLMGNCKIIIISQKAFEKVDGDQSSMNPRLLIDHADILEKMNLPVAGFTLIRFKAGAITTIKYYNPEVSEQPLAMFFSN